MAAPKTDRSSGAYEAARAAKLTDADLRRFAELVKGEAGIVLNDDKSALIQSRLYRRLASTGHATFQSYYDFINSDSGRDEFREMLHALTTNVTRFYREPHHFDDLRRNVLPKAAMNLKAGKPVRIWSCACSTGEEPYTVAMEILAQIPDAGQRDVRILATDLNADIVGRARAGVYPAAALETMPSEMARQHFQPAGDDGRGMVRVTDNLRRLVRFNVLNLIKGWPMRGQFDAIFCRNVMIYFDRETQEALLQRLAAICRPGGTLYIGHSERITGPAASLFANHGLTTYRVAGGSH